MVDCIIPHVRNNVPRTGPGSRVTNKKEITDVGVVQELINEIFNSSVENLWKKFQVDLRAVDIAFKGSQV